jgi:folate-binding protein YgfZ
MDCFFTVPSAIVLEVSGRDAARYLNARLTNDIKKLLSPDKAVLAAALTPQGRTQALFLVSGDLGSIVTLVCDAGDGQEVVAAFKKYIVADRVDVTDRSSDISIVHLIGRDTIDRALLDLGITQSELLEFQVFNSNRMRAIVCWRSSEIGLDLMMPKDQLSGVVGKLRSTGLKELSRDEQEFRRIAAGLPAFPQELNEDTLFSESGLAQAISFNKGCYTGQEVIEKVDSHGKLSRALRLIRVVEPYPAVVGDQVYQELKNAGEGPVIGKVVSLAKDLESGVSVCFIQLKNDPNLAAQSVLVRGNQWEVVDLSTLRA